MDMTPPPVCPAGLLSHLEHVTKLDFGRQWVNLLPVVTTAKILEFLQNLRQARVRGDGGD